MMKLWWKLASVVLFAQSAVELVVLNRNVIWHIPEPVSTQHTLVVFVAAVFAWEKGRRKP